MKHLQFNRKVVDIKPNAEHVINGYSEIEQIMEKNTIEKSELHSQMNAMNSQDLTYKDALDLRTQYQNVREVVDEGNEVSI